MSEAPRPRRTWPRLVAIAVVILIAAFLLLLATDGGGLFDYDTF